MSFSQLASMRELAKEAESELVDISHRSGESQTPANTDKVVTDKYNRAKRRQD